jgi:SAM-dependent methyltransferase
VPLEFYLEAYERLGGPALELMCGSGRFLIPWLQRGARMDGVDASPEMLAACRRRVQDAGLEANLYEQFLERLDLPRSYRLLVMTSGSFSLLDSDAAAMEGLRRCYQHLEPGGELILEVLTMGTSGEQSGNLSPARSVTRPDGAEIVVTEVARDTRRYDLVRAGQVLATEMEHLPLRLYEPATFVDMLRAAGFDGVHAERAYTREPPKPEDRLLVFHGTRT